MVNQQGGKCTNGRSFPDAGGSSGLPPRQDQLGLRQLAGAWLARSQDRPAASLSAVRTRRVDRAAKRGGMTARPIRDIRHPDGFVAKLARDLELAADEGQVAAGLRCPAASCAKVMSPPGAFRSPVTPARLLRTRAPSAVRQIWIGKEKEISARLACRATRSTLAVPALGQERKPRCPTTRGRGWTSIPNPYDSNLHIPASRCLQRLDDV
jgi:hypothetical protein